MGDYKPTYVEVPPCECGRKREVSQVMGGGYAVWCQGCGRGEMIRAARRQDIPGHCTQCGEPLVRPSAPGCDRCFHEEG